MALTVSYWIALMVEILKCAQARVSTGPPQLCAVMGKHSVSGLVFFVMRTPCELYVCLCLLYTFLAADANNTCVCGE